MQNYYLKVIKRKWQGITLLVLSLMVLALVLSLVQPLKYRSRTEYLIVQKQSLAMDAYEASRASEKIAGTLGSIIQTQSFLNKIINGNFGISATDFPYAPNKQRKAWEKTIDYNVYPEKSMLRIDVFHEDKNKADAISRAVAYTIINNASEYHGAGDDLIIKIVNEPLLSNYPVKPNVILNTLTALVFGLLLGISWAIYSFEKNTRPNYQENFEENQTLNYKDQIS